MSQILIREVDSLLLEKVFGLKLGEIFFNGVGDVYSYHSKNLLSYIKDDKYIKDLCSNEFISGVFSTRAVSKLLPSNITTIIVDDPNFYFFKLIDYFGSLKMPPSCINSKAHSTATISPYGVIIGENVVIEPNVTILSGVTIGDNVTIRTGAVLGLDTFQHQRTTKGIISPKHDGLLIIGNDVEIGANVTISKGFSYRSTKVCDNTKIDAQVYIGHGAQIDSEVFICAGARIMGHCKIGQESFIGPGAVVSSRINVGVQSRISIGSVVTKDVDSNSIVSGNFAIPHSIFLQQLKKAISS